MVLIMLSIIVIANKEKNQSKNNTSKICKQEILINNK